MSNKYLEKIAEWHPVWGGIGGAIVGDIAGTTAAVVPAAIMANHGVKTGKHGWIHAGVNLVRAGSIVGSAMGARKGYQMHKAYNEEQRKKKHE